MLLNRMTAAVEQCFVMLLLCVHITQMVSALSTPTTEWEALRDLYDATAGDNWLPSETDERPIWNFTLSSAGDPLHDPCSDGGQAWRGLQCNRSAIECSESFVACSVLEVILEGSGLNGTLPDSLSHITFLERMDMFNNNIQGNIPSSFGIFFNLTMFDVGNNAMTGTLPAELCSLLRLNVLRVEWNSFVGSLPTAVSNLQNLQEFAASMNQLTGTIPDGLCQLGQLNVLALDNNIFTGSIPTEIGSLINMVFLTLAANLLTGSIPVSMYNLSALEHFWLFDNWLSGPAMLPAISQLTALLDISLHYNAFTGSVPDLSHSQALVYLYLEYNWLTGSLPSSLGSLTALEHIYLSNNAFTGQLPHFSNMTHLEYLYLDRNRLTGSLPISLGSLHSLLELQLRPNPLTGSLPAEVGQLWKLNFLSVHDNYFTNSLEGIFHSALNLHSIDLGDNAFSGSIPPSLLDIQTLSVVVLSSNCFTGDLPASLCHPGAATVFSMDGLGAAKHCKHREEMLFSGVTMFNTLRGSIPSCVWSMSNLTVLHLSGNGFTGKISSEQFHLPAIINLSLAHNRLSGTVPPSLLAHPFKWCDLSYNRFTGVLDDNIKSDADAAASLSVGYNESRFVLQVNRLSGHFPSFVHRGVYSSLKILWGNLFGCIEDFPQADDDKDDYVCGSSDLDDAHWLLVVMLAVVLMGILFLVLAVPKWTSLQTVCCRRLHLLITHQLFYTRCVLCTSSPQIDIMPMENETNSAMLYRIRMFCVELHNAAKVILFAAVASILLSIPLYTLKILDSTMEEPSYSTHYVQYSWLYTAALLTGTLPALLLITVWTFLMVFLFCAFPYFVDKRSIETAPDAAAPASAASSQKATKRDTIMIPPVESKSSVQLNLKMCCLFLLNSIIVSTVNALFIYSTYQSLSSAAHNILQMLLALFKTSYNFRVVPTIASPIRDKNTNIYFRLCLSLFNQLLIPCIVGALTSPSCFKGLLVEEKEFSSTYFFSQCYWWITYADGSMVCREYQDTTSEVEGIVPPFIYNYDCGSTLIQVYLPVYLYMYIYQFLLACGFTPLWSSFDFEVFPVWLQTRLSGLVWPDVWYGDNNVQSDSSDFDQFRIPTTKKLSKFKTIVSSDIFRHVVVLVTFGVCSPLLATLISLSVLIKLHMWIALIGRFVHFRIVTKARNHSEDTEEHFSDREKTMPTLSEWLHLYPPILPHDLSSEEQARMLSQPVDIAFVCLAEGLLPIQVVFDRCFPAILWSSALFMGGISWDLASNGGGWREGQWAPLLCVAVASLLWIYSKVMAVSPPAGPTHSSSSSSSSPTTTRTTQAGAEDEHSEKQHGAQESPPSSEGSADTRSAEVEDLSRINEDNDNNDHINENGNDNGIRSVSSLHFRRSGGEVELSESLTINPLLMP